MQCNYVNLQLILTRNSNNISLSVDCKKNAFVVEHLRLGLQFQISYNLAMDEHVLSFT